MSNYQKNKNRRSKNNFPSKKSGQFKKEHYLCTHENPPSLSTMLKCAGRFFLYDEQQNPISETIRPMLPNRMTGSWITLPTDALRIYFNLCIIKYFLNIISPNNDMKSKVNALLAANPSIDISAMGFPRGWESEPLWQ